MLIIFAIVAALFFFQSSKSVQEEITTAEADKAILDKQLERYSYIDNYYGRSSDNFRADKPIVILRGNGATELIHIYRANKSDLVAYRNIEELLTEWTNNNGENIDFKVTSKIAHGYTVINFKNKNSNETFNVLVVIK